jgi:hypothetical protein
MIVTVSQCHLFTVFVLLYPHMVCEHTPQVACDHYQQGMSAFEKGEIDRAVTEFSKGNRSRVGSLGFQGVRERR